MQRPFLIFSQSDYLIQIVDINSHILSEADWSGSTLFQRQVILEFSMTRLKSKKVMKIYFKGPCWWKINWRFVKCIQKSLHLNLFPPGKYFMHLSFQYWPGSVSTLWANFRCPYFFPENRIWCFMQTVSISQRHKLVYYPTTTMWRHHHYDAVETNIWIKLYLTRIGKLMKQCRRRSNFSLGTLLIWIYSAC